MHAMIKGIEKMQSKREMRTAPKNGCDRNQPDWNNSQGVMVFRRLYKKIAGGVRERKVASGTAGLRPGAQGEFGAALGLSPYPIKMSASEPKADICGTRNPARARF